ncbi:MAG: hypothetical protein ABG776_12640 [Cyanobacteria bacterium J06555_13]
MAFIQRRLDYKGGLAKGALAKGAVVSDRRKLAHQVQCQSPNLVPSGRFIWFPSALLALS